MDDFGFYCSASLLLGWATKHNRFSLVPRSSSRHGGSRRRSGCVEEKRVVGGWYTWWHACGDGRVGNPLSRGPRFNGVGYIRHDTACYGFGPLGVVEFEKEKPLDFPFESAAWLGLEQGHAELAVHAARLAKLGELFPCPQYVLGQGDKWTGGNSREMLFKKRCCAAIVNVTPCDSPA